MIEFDDVHYTYHDGTKALRGVTYTIRKGEKIALVGPNGSGKSTFLLHTNGILLPTSGTVRIDGRAVDQKNAKEIRTKVGIVFQDADDQVFSPTVFEDAVFGPMNLRLDKEEVIQRAHEALELVGLEGYERRSAHHLSGGEKKKVALAGVLAMRPEVIVLDEPTANLDPYSAHSLMELLDELHGAGKTILIATHEVDVVCEWADRVCVLHNGVVVRDSTPAEAFSDAALMAETRLRPPIVYRVFEGITNPTPTSIRQARDKLKKLTQK
ncbi:MAG: energy-coupling factor ABC transporter ATP-binding protein [Halobacteriota archaeon]